LGGFAAVDQSFDAARTRKKGHLFGVIRKRRRKSKSSSNEQHKDVAATTEAFSQAVTRKVKVKRQ